MALLPTIDKAQTRRNAKSVLKTYRKCERIAGRSKIDVKSPIITDMPKSVSIGNKAEDALLQLMDAESERDAIISAIMRLKFPSRQILYYSYCHIENWSNQAIACELNYSLRQIERMKQEALIEFAEAYRRGKLLAYR